MSTARKLAFQADILEWARLQKVPLRVLRRERRKMEKGFLAYGKDIIGFLRPVRKGTATEVSVTTATPETSTESNSAKAMSQFYEAQDLTKRMKWKRVTWDDKADYEMFAKRLLENDAMFKRAPAFSFLSIHVTKDPSATNLMQVPTPAKVVESGMLTNWLLQERECATVEPYPTRTVTEKQSAFQVDWTSGAVNIIDTASAQEVLTFLSTVAPRLQSVQLKMEEQQLKQVADIENVRVRVGATLKFNDFNTSFWDDPKRKTDPNFVNPDDLQMFLDGMLKAAFLYRCFFKSLEIQVLPPGRPYYVDLEKKIVQMPANFAEFNWMRAHLRFESMEKVANSFRRFWWLWFSLGMVVVGDVDVL